MLTTLQSSQLVKFLIVGFLGTVTNLGIFFVLVDLLHFNHIVIAICAFAVAAAQNYWLNHMWTFSNATSDMPLSFRGYTKFLSVSMGGLIVNLAILTLIILLIDPAWKVTAQAVGILGGAMINYVGSKYWVFSSHG